MLVLFYSAQSPPLSLFTAIASAGGLTERGNKSRIELKRRSGSDLTTQILNLETNRVSKLQDGDTLIVHAIPEVVVEEEQVVTITVPHVYVNSTRVAGLCR